MEKCFIWPVGENVVSMMSIAQSLLLLRLILLETSKARKALKLDGNIGLDFMKNTEGVPVLMDINPRITATVSVIAAAGLNLPYLRIKQLLGEHLPVCNVDYGTRLKRRYGETYTDSKGNQVDLGKGKE